MTIKKTSRRKPHPIYDREATAEEVARARAWCEANGAYGYNKQVQIGNVIWAHFPKKQNARRIRPAGGAS
jgi:hypothetical protein